MNILLSSGVIIEPYVEEAVEGNSSNGLVIGLLISLTLTVIFVGLALLTAEPKIFIVPAITVIISVILAVNIYKLTEVGDSGSQLRFYEEQVALILSEHYNFEVSPEQVSNSGLLNAVEAGVVKELVYSDEKMRDLERDLWVREVRSFLVDGKVVEIYISREPLEQDASVE